MAYIYILYSKSRDRYYVGSTDNLVRRFSEHNRGKTTSTKAGRPWQLMYSHDAATLLEARKIERRIKTLRRRDYIEAIVREQRLTTKTSVPT